jgi:hypothetical protein
MMAVAQSERDHLRDLDVNGRKILKQIIKKQCVRMWTGFVWLWIWASSR